MLFTKTLFVALAGLSAMAFAAPVDAPTGQIEQVEQVEPAQQFDQVDRAKKDPCNGRKDHEACDRARHKKPKTRGRFADAVDVVEVGA